MRSTKTSSMLILPSYKTLVSSLLSSRLKLTSKKDRWKLKPSKKSVKFPNKKFANGSETSQLRDEKTRRLKPLSKKKMTKEDCMKLIRSKRGGRVAMRATPGGSKRRCLKGSRSI